jgi:hypothetical protein
MAAITLVVTTVLVTIAFLTSSSGVSNVFTIGDISIEMFEHKVDNNTGEFLDGMIETDTNSYHLVPDTNYKKDPTIRITTKNDADQMYLFVKSTNMIRTIEAANVDPALATASPTMRQQMKKYGWVEYLLSSDGVEIVWVYGTRNPTTGEITPLALDRTHVQDGGNGKAGEIKLCDEFTIAEKANTSVYGAARVDFTAYAIQVNGSEGLKDSWENIKDTFPFEGGINDPRNPYNGAKDEAAYAPVPDDQVVDWQNPTEQP